MLTLPLILLLSSPLAAAPAPSPALNSLVSADYSFADTVNAKSIRDGFMATLRKDSVVFIPRPVNGLDYYRTQLETGAQLHWSSVVADAAQSGDLGYTSGPFTFRRAKGESDSAFGWFVTLWQREGNGPWQPRLDIGIPTPDPSDNPQPAALPRPAAAALAPVAGPLGNPAELLDLDRAFAKEAEAASRPGTKDYTAAYKAHVDDNVRFYRRMHFPVEGSKRLTVALDPGPVTWEPQEGFVAASGDLGCTRGILRHTQQDGTQTTCSYVRMWRKTGPAWKLTLDLELDLPQTK